MALALSFTEQTYSSTNKPSVDTLKADLSQIETTFNTFESTAVTDDSTSTLTNKTLTSPVINTGVSGTAILDEDNMASDSATKLATQQSIKAYADTKLPLSGGTMTGPITLGENTALALDPAGSADGKYSGITVAGMGGATIAFGDLVTLDKDDSRWELADISVAAAATGDARGVLGIAVTSSTDGGALTVLLHGIVRADANFPTLTIGAPVYASTTGDIVVTQPTTPDYVLRVIGFGLTADELYFSPDNTYTTHV